MSASLTLDWDIDARHAQVLGDEPRVGPLGEDEFSAEARRLVEKIRASSGGGAMDEVPEYFLTMARHEELFRCQLEMGTAVYLGKLPGRERELAILRNAWLCGAPYEWGEHVTISKRFGLTAEEIARVPQGADGGGWNELDTAILRAVDELHADKVIGDETWAILSNYWDDAQMIEFPMMVGQYIATALVQNSIRARLAPENSGLGHR